MVYFLILVSAITSIVGNITAKYWADHNRLSWLIVTLLAFTISTLAYAYSLRFGQFTLVNALFYAVVPIITVLFGIFLFHDRLTTLQLIGLTFGFLAIVFFTIEGKVEFPK